MLRTEGLSVRAAGRYLIEDISIALGQEFVLVRGPSGAGKTTLMRCLAGLIPHAFDLDMQGRVLLGGEPTTDMSLPDIASRVAMVFQRPETQLFNLFVADEIAFAPRNAGLPEAEVASWSGDAAAALGIEHLLARRVTELSGGEKQRVAIASALAMHPEVLILDEPFSQLDIQGAVSLADALGRLHNSGAGVVVIEQYPERLQGLASRELHIDGGEVVFDGPPHDEAPDHSGEQWEALLDPAPMEAKGDELVRLENASVRRDRTEVLRGVNLSLNAGERIALVGPNGSGKSTIAGLLAGTIKPTRGSVERPAKLRIGLVPQSPSWMLLADTARQEIEIGASSRTGSATPPEELLSALGLAAVADHPPSLLSSGEMRRLCFAAALAGRPDLLIVDEPAAGQHREARETMMSLAAQRCEQGGALLFITHDLDLVRRWATRIIVLRDGQITAEGSPVALRKAGTVEDT